MIAAQQNTIPVWDGVTVTTPAFVDDIMGLAIGPLFVVAELAFLCGLRKPLEEEIEKRLSTQSKK